MGLVAPMCSWRSPIIRSNSKRCLARLRGRGPSTSRWTQTCSVLTSLRQKAGIDTLDAPAEAREAAKNCDVSEYERIRIRGFLRDGVSFGGASAFKGRITNGEDIIECALLIPDLTRHMDVIEVISIHFLRETLGVSDGDRITLSL